MPTSTLTDLSSTITATDLAQVAIPAQIGVKEEHDMACVFKATFRLPSEVMQDNRLVAEYPASLWDHVKLKLRGWGLTWFKPKVPEVRVHQVAVYPAFPAVHRDMERVRIAFMPKLETVGYR
jgi:hypothetical protein